MRNLARLVVLCLLVAGCGEVVNSNRNPDAPVEEPDADGSAGPDADGMLEPDGEEQPGLVSITVTAAGAGAGVVVSDPAGISCPGTCTLEVEPGTAVTLSVQPEPGATFEGWTGGCGGSDVACQLVVDADVTIGAAFGVQNHTVTVTKSGGGTGTVTGSGINCGGTCEVAVPHGTTVSLSATPSGTGAFAGWGGGCSGPDACTITVTGDVTVNAAFIEQSFTLVVARAGLGSGTVTSNIAGIACGSDCDEPYTSGQQVTLTAVADASSVFTGFTGSGCSGTGPCVVTIGPTNVVTANFVLKQYTLAVTTTGTGTGRVTSTPSGINCGTSCDASYDHGTNVTLSPAAAIGSTFTGWAGACTGTGACVVAMTQARSVTARFTAVAPNIAFVTSTSHAPSSLGGLAGADAICQAEASRAGLVGTGSTQNPQFVAWLSSSTSNAADRIGTARGWVRPDGRPFIDTMSDLANNRVYYPPRLSATGTVQEVTANIATNTRTDGTFSGSAPACTSASAGGEYVGSVGTNVLGGPATAVSSMLTGNNSNPCTTERRLLCLGVGRTARVVPTSIAGRNAFTTDGSFTVGGGIAAADALCASEATAAGLPGTYKALLATNGASAISRFNTATGAAWVRSSDGIALTTLARAMGTALEALETAPNTNAKGNTRYGSTTTWTGAATLTTPGTASTTCGNWTATTSTGTGGRAGDTAISTWFGRDASGACTSTARKLICLQE